MKSKKNRKAKKMSWEFSLKPIFKYNIIFGILVLVAVALGGIFFTVKQMEERTKAACNGIETQIEYRISQTLRLLEMLTSQRQYYDPDVSVDKKIKNLDAVNEKFGYMMIRYVDENMNVYSDRGPTNLASREYLQRLFSSGEYQVTDCFAAGADGVTLNYTVAMPLMQDQKITGCIFAAIYFDEIAGLLQEHALTMRASASVLGSQQQIMSATNELSYGVNYIEILKDYKIINTNGAKIEAALLNQQEGAFWSFGKGDAMFNTYASIEGTNWNIVSSSSFWVSYLAVFTTLLPIMFGCMVLFGAMMWSTNHYTRGQKKVVDALLLSVQELEKKIYQDERPNNVDFHSIIKLTSKGLSDGLTGVVTRTVFMDQAKSLLGRSGLEGIIALCFVDLDDLKTLNDTYGHEIGDISLKSVGYVLREYEKKYEGLVGRYGGDEFILLLKEIESQQELQEVLDELVLRLHTTVSHKGAALPIQCSLGVSIWNGTTDVDTLIKEADEALYFVKQNGKGYYKIYQD